MAESPPLHSDNLNAQFREVYVQLKELAHNRLRSERPDHTLNTTGLVHEVYLKLVKQDKQHFENEYHFMALAAQSMRRILIDYARKQKSQKRGGDQLKITHNEEVMFLQTTPEEVIQLHEHLSRLEKLNDRQSKVIECWFFGGFNHEEIAQILDTSVATVRRDWRLARLWLSKEMK